MSQSTANAPLPLQLREPLRLLVFDLDGVITSEKRYWSATRSTFTQLFVGERYLNLPSYFAGGADQPGQAGALAQSALLDEIIYDLKSRAINSNWDKTFLLVSAHSIGVLRHWFDANDNAAGLPLATSDSVAAVEQQLCAIGRSLQSQAYTAERGAAMLAQFLAAHATLGGDDLINALQPFADAQLGAGRLALKRKGGLWQLCYLLFQAYYHSSQALVDEETVLPRGQIAALLHRLTSAHGYTLGIATGRPRAEVLAPLEQLGLLSYFAQERIVTMDEVLAAETALLASGQTLLLGKPHPFSVLKAIYPGEPMQRLLAAADGCRTSAFAAYIGDSSSDIIAARRAGCVAIGVLTGVKQEEAIKLEAESTLIGLGCDIVLDSILALPYCLGHAAPHKRYAEHGGGG